MNARALRVSTATADDDVEARIGAIDWTRVARELDAQGSAIIERLLSRDECTTLASLYGQDGRFRSRVVMRRHGYGSGEYKYFSYPLPGLVAHLRAALYPPLVPIANRWYEALGIDVRFPMQHAQFIERCHAAGQRRPRRCCSPMAPTTTTACIRTSMASTCFRCN